MDGTESVARFIREAEWETLPPDVQRKVKQCLLDALGAALSGTVTPISRMTAAYAARAWQGDEATILLHGKKATATGAAFANGYAANAFDTDDGADFTKGHPGAQLIPTALAVAEKLDKGGREVLTALAVGYEVAIRMGRCWHDRHAEWQACGSWGSVASAACAARLMGLDAGQIRHALGIAEYYAPNVPMMRDIDHPAMVKHGIGWGAMTGVTAAELAACGFTGIPTLFSCEEYRDWAAAIGRPYLMTDAVWFKDFASCGFGHAAVNGARRLVQQYGVRAEDIEHIRVEAYHETLRLGTRLPKTTEEAQFNTAWPLAAYLIDGEIGPRQMRDERLTDEAVIALARKVELVESPLYSEWARLRLLGDGRGKQVARVEFTLRDGRTLDSGEVEAIAYHGAALWDEARLARKFKWLLQDVLPDRLADELIDMVWAFDQVEDVRALTSRLLRAPA